MCKQGVAMQVRVITLVLSTGILFGKPPALPNLSNSCYMNAALQTLFAMTDLNTFIMSYKPLDNLPHYLALPAYKNLLQERNTKEFNDALREFFYITDISLTQQTEWDAIKKYAITLKDVNLKRVKEIIDSKKPGLEKDFLNFVLERNKDLEPVLTEDRLKNDIYFFLSDKYIPQKCQQSASEMIEKFLAQLLELNPPYIHTLFMQVQDYVMHHESGYVEPIEHEIENAVLRISVPSTMQTIQNLLENYFSPRATDQPGLVRQKKIETEVPTYVLLALGRTDTGQFLSTPITQLASLILHGAWFKHTIPDALSYSLIGIICHSGGTTGGHYRAYVYDAHDQEWYVGDDQFVKLVAKRFEDFEELRKQEIATQSTLLVYQKTGVVKDTPPPLENLYNDLAFLEFSVRNS